MRMEDVSNKVSVPKDIYDSLWENIAHIVTHTLVEGYVKCFIYNKFIRISRFFFISRTASIFYMYV